MIELSIFITRTDFEWALTESNSNNLKFLNIIILSRRVVEYSKLVWNLNKLKKHVRTWFVLVTNQTQTSFYRIKTSQIWTTWFVYHPYSHFQFEYSTARQLAWFHFFSSETIFILKNKYEKDTRWHNWHSKFAKWT